MERSKQRLSCLAALLFATLFCGAADRVTLEEILRPLERPDAAASLLASVEAGSAVPAAAAATVAPTDFQTIGMTEILPDLQRWMETYLTGEGELIVGAARQWRGIRLPTGSDWTPVWGTEVRPDSRGLVYPKLSIRVGERLYGPWTLAVQVEVWREVWVTREPLRRGQIPVGPGVETARVNVLGERGVPVPAETGLGGFEMAQAVAEGKVLTWADVAPRPSVRRGEVVEVALDQGALQIRMKARALEAGKEGDLVFVRNLDSRREFQARVVGPNLVEVRL